MLSELLLSIWPNLYTTKYVRVKSYMSRGGHNYSWLTWRTFKLWCNCKSQLLLRIVQGRCATINVLNCICLIDSYWRQIGQEYSVFVSGTYNCLSREGPWNISADKTFSLLEPKSLRTYKEITLKQGSWRSDSGTI